MRRKKLIGLTIKCGFNTAINFIQLHFLHLVDLSQDVLAPCPEFSQYDKEKEVNFIFYCPATILNDWDFLGIRLSCCATASYLCDVKSVLRGCEMLCSITFCMT